MTFNKKLLIGVIAGIVIFLAIDLLYFNKALSGDYTLSAHDVTMFKGAAKEVQDYREATGEEALWTNSMFGGMPAFQISVIYANHALSYLNNIFQLFLPHPAGIVFLYFIGFFILMLCLRVNPWIGIVCAIAYAFSSYFFIILVAGHNTKAVALGYAPALFGAVMLLYQRKWLLGVALTALFMGLELYANHPQITYYIFLLLALVIIFEGVAAFKEKRIADFFKSSALALVGILIGVAPNVSSLWSTAEYGKYTIRGPSELTINADRTKNEDKKALPLEYALHYSYGVSESFTLLIPDFKGGGSGEGIQEKLGDKRLDNIKEEYYEDVMGQGSYYGEQTALAGPVYAGAIVVLLSFFALFYLRSIIKWPLFIGSVLALMLSWGRFFPGFSEFFFNYFPYYNKFRAVSMMLIVVEFVLPLLAALALNQLLEDREAANTAKAAPKDPPYKRPLIIATSVIGVFLLMCLVAPGMVNDFRSSRESVDNYEKMVREQMTQQMQQQNPAATPQQISQQIESQLPQYVEGYKQFLPELEKARKAVFRQDVLRTFLFFILGGGLLFLFAYRKIKFEIFIAGLGILILVDLWMVNQRYLNKEKFVEKTEEGEITPTPADDYILKDKEAKDFRVVNTAVDVFNNATVSYFHKSIGGYHGAKLKRYQEMIEFHIGREVQIGSNIADAGLPDSMAIGYLNQSTPVLNMLNTRYIITRKNISGTPYKNPAANGNAWFVSQIRWAPNADSEIVWTGDINTKTTAVIQEKYKQQLQGIDKIAGSWATVKLEDYKPNHLRYSFDSQSQQFVVFSEVYYPAYPAGWNVYLDGQLSTYVPVNYILRGMMVPAGKHTIEFKFEPKSYITGEKISFPGVILFYLTVFGGLGAFVYTRMKKKNG